MIRIFYSILAVWQLKFTDQNAHFCAVGGKIAVLLDTRRPNRYFPRHYEMLALRPCRVACRIQHPVNGGTDPLASGNTRGSHCQCLVVTTRRPCARALPTFDYEAKNDCAHKFKSSRYSRELRRDCYDSFRSRHQNSRRSFCRHARGRLRDDCFLSGSATSHPNNRPG